MANLSFQLKVACRVIALLSLVVLAAGDLFGRLLMYNDTLLLLLSGQAMGIAPGGDPAR